MITLQMIQEHLGRFPLPELAGKTVPADVLIAYLFLAHDHDSVTEQAIVESMPLERFILNYLREA